VHKIPVGVLGATGTVGQRFIQLLADHPWFRVTAVAASQRWAGERYADACSMTASLCRWLHNWDRERELATDVQFTFYVNPPAMDFHDLLSDRKT
jgi:aspartate-semialdehyde dehydrogenase